MSDAPTFDRDARERAKEALKKGIGERTDVDWLAVHTAVRWAVQITEGDGELMWTPSFEQLELTEANPKATYLDDYDQVWIGARWDIARRGDLWNVYRKGNHFASLQSSEMARLVVADWLGSRVRVWPPVPVESPKEAPGE